MNKKKIFLTVITFLSAICWLTFESAPALYRGPGAAAQSAFKATRIIIKIIPDQNKSIRWSRAQGIMSCGIASIDRLNGDFKVSEQARLFEDVSETALKSEDLAAIYILSVPAGTDVQEMAREYGRLPEIEYAEPDLMVDIYRVPNDPLASNQWYLNNEGQQYLGTNRLPGDGNDTQVLKTGTEDADVDANEAFDSTGQTTVPLVGIIDSGVDYDHEDLADNMWVNPGEDLNGNGRVDEIEKNGLDDDYNGFVDDFYGWDFSGGDWVNTFDFPGDNDPADNDTLLHTAGHGTHCAGIVAAVRDNGIGVAGLASPCRIMAIKIFPNALYSVCGRAIVYAADMNCDIINMSWGGPWPSGVIDDAITYARKKGVIPMAAAGNSGGYHYFYPASLSQVFTVGASNSDDEVTHFSTYGDQIEVVAPGEDILSLRADNTDIYASGGASGIEPNVHIVDDRYYLMDGTSMASPVAVGVAAHLLAASPGTDGERIMEIIMQSADDIIYPYGGDSLYSPGKDIYSGHGRVNLYSALQLLSGRLAKIDYPYHRALVTGDVPVFGTASGETFEEYILEYGAGRSPDTWVEIARSSEVVNRDTLGVWNSTGLTGLYTLRLTVGEGNQFLRDVIAANDTRIEIAFPHEGDTLEGHIEMIGSTIIPDFSHYTIEYGIGDSPSQWETLLTSTRLAAEDILGSLALSFRPSNLYSFRLTAESGDGTVYTDQVTIRLENVSASVWSYILPSFGSISPAVGDVDGDGMSEIIIGIGSSANWGLVGGITVLDHTGRMENGWPRDTLENMMSSPAVADLDGDGVDDIAIVSEQAGMRAYLSAAPDWIRPYQSGGGILDGLAAPVIADLEGDGLLEVLSINSSGYVYAWRWDGQPVGQDNTGLLVITGFGVNTFGKPSVSVADLDQDGKNEIIVGSADFNSPDSPGYGVGVFDIDANTRWSSADVGDSLRVVTGIAIANIDDENDLEIIAVACDFDYLGVWAYKSDGRHVDGYPILIDELNTGNWFSNHPAVGDLDGDGKVEIVITVWTIGEARVYAWHQDGTPLGRIEAEDQPGDDPIFAVTGENIGSPILADVNGDGMTDIVAQVAGSMTVMVEKLWAWDYEGEVIPGFPLYCADEPEAFGDKGYVPLVTDLDRDNRVDLVVSTNRPTNRLISWEFDIPYDSAAMPWPRFRHDRWNSGIWGGPNLPTAAEDEQGTPVPLTYSLSGNYPNPFNAATTIQYTIPKRSRVTLTVYNILGQRIRVLVDGDEMAGDKQAVWDGKNSAGKVVASGVYFYQLETAGFSDTRKMLLLK